MRKQIPDYVKQLAADMRKTQTMSEQIMWNRIRNKQLEGYRFTRQYPIGRYIVDFYCSKANLVVEIDGKGHEETNRKEYDKIREEVIKAQGIRIVRFTNDEIMNCLDCVLTKLLDYLKL